jgi:hypothetical protein
LLERIQDNDPKRADPFKIKYMKDKIMKKSVRAAGLNYFIAIIWIVNGLFCKVLNLVPRHQQIVEKILNIENARALTLVIGIAEIGMAIWVLSNFGSKPNAIIQIFIIATMNALEFFLAPDLLLWGKMNAVFAFLFILLILYKGFYLPNKIKQQVICYHS